MGLLAPRAPCRLSLTLGLPVGCRNSYSLYCAELMANMKDVPSTERMVLCSQQWKLLSQKEKDAYHKKCDQVSEDGQAGGQQCCGEGGEGRESSGCGSASSFLSASSCHPHHQFLGGLLLWSCVPARVWDQVMVRMKDAVGGG